MTYVRRYGDDFDADDGTLIENYTPPADGLGAWSRGNADSGYWKIWHKDHEKFLDFTLLDSLHVATLMDIGVSTRPAK